MTELVQALFIMCDEIFHAMEVEDDVTMDSYLTKSPHDKRTKRVCHYLVSMSALNIFLFIDGSISLNPTG